MEVQPNVTLFNYFRISALMWALLIFDVYYVCYAVALSYVRGPSIQILFGFEVSYRSWLDFSVLLLIPGFPVSFIVLEDDLVACENGIQHL